MTVQMFSQEVIRGFSAYNNIMAFRSITATGNYVMPMEIFIFVMTARIPSEALKPGRPSAVFLADLLTYKDEWDMYANNHNGGFISASTALDLHDNKQHTRPSRLYNIFPGVWLPCYLKLESGLNEYFCLPREAVTRMQRSPNARAISADCEPQSFTIQQLP